MTTRIFCWIVLIWLSLSVSGFAQEQVTRQASGTNVIGSTRTSEERIPHLRKQGSATQLIVDGSPFLVIGGELHNSSSSDLAYMKAIWQRMVDLNINTVLTPVSWELIEPEEGRFDFTLIDGLIQEARSHDLRLIFLWLSSWKNGMSSYIPVWVKKDYKRFTRVEVQKGETVEVLSTLSEANWQADAKAFAALMCHIRQVDDKDHSVIMMQVENEVGILGDSRDRCALANQAFSQPAPKELMDNLQETNRRWFRKFANAGNPAD